MACAVHQERVPPQGFAHGAIVQLTVPDAPDAHAFQWPAHRGRLVSHAVLARDDVLRIFEVRERGASTELVQVRMHRLFGEVTGVLRVRTLASQYDGRDRVLLAFADAKLALMEWSDAYGDVHTVSIHTFERAPQLAQGVRPWFVPALRVDPGSQCAALLLPQDALAILPLYQDVSELQLGDEAPSAAQIVAHVPYAPSFVLSLPTDVDAGIRNVRDLLFLPGFQKPTLAVLYEAQLTWTGSLSAAKQTMHVCFVTLDLTVAHYPVTVTSEALPYDCLYLAPCPASLGGVMIVTPSAVLHMDPTARLVGVAVNAWYECASAGLPLPHADVGAPDLQGSQLVFVDATHALLFCADGTARTLRCDVEGRSVTALTLCDAEVPTRRRRPERRRGRDVRGADGDVAPRTVVALHGALGTLEPRLRTSLGASIAPALQVWSAALQHATTLVFGAWEEQCVVYAYDEAGAAAAAADDGAEAPRFVAQYAGRTLACAAAPDAQCAVRVTPTHLAYVDATGAARDEALDGGVQHKKVTAACFGGAFLALHWDGGEIEVRRFEGGAYVPMYVPLTATYAGVDVYVDAHGALSAPGHAWLVLTYATGSIELRTLPDGALHWRSRTVGAQPSRLGARDGAPAELDVDVARVAHVRLVTLGDVPTLVCTMRTAPVAVTPRRDDDRRARGRAVCAARRGARARLRAGRSEVVTALHVARLDARDRRSARRAFVVVGTTTQYGEDRIAKGHMYVFDVVDATPYDPAVRDTMRLVLVCREEMRAPVTALSSLNGYLVAAVGQKLLVRSLEFTEWLVTIAFLETAFCTTSIQRVKNFLLLTDYHRSASFVAFQEEPAQLHVLGRDFARACLSAGGLLIHREKLALVTADLGGVVRLLDYNPANPTSLGGQRLLVRTEYHVGSEVVQALVLPGPRDAASGECFSSEVLLAKRNGAVDVLVPVDDKVLSILQLFQGQLVRSVRHTAGLNPRAFRAVPNVHVARPLTKGILDGALLHAAEAMSRPKLVRLVRDLQTRTGGVEPDDVLRCLAHLQPQW
ncbi:CFT1 [Malassezia furfur]|nr:CFT1 [Malassezia furfur]